MLVSYLPLASRGKAGVEPKELRDLIEIISKSSFTTFELEREGFKLRLVKGAASPVVIQASPKPSPALGEPAATAVAAAVPPPAAAPADDGLAVVTSPIVGTFYRAPSPGAPPFVEVGSRVAKGQVLCIVEAMKLMNEIECEIDAEVVEIVVANGQPVEYGEAIFKLRPMA